MISKDEILERAHILSLEPSVVEKDYVLGWLLHAIGSHAELAEQWVFKGGTSRKQVQGGPDGSVPRVAFWGSPGTLARRTRRYDGRCCESIA